MRTVIVGASRFGTATAQELIEDGHEVVIVDSDAHKLEELADRLDCGFIEGDGTLPSVLRDAFGDHADALVLLTNEDDVNILAAVVGRSIGFERVIPQIVRAELLAVCDELELKDVITPHSTVARSIVQALKDQSDTSVDLRLHKGIRVVGYAITADRDGKTVGELDLPGDSRVIARAHGEEETLVDDDTELKEGDHLIIAVAADALEDVEAVLAPKKR
ncbi:MULTISPECIES: TrkA family potassium uptake protein [unclassified Roseitalea]|uniref:potassium channel family protein n=1 Tax=unclassified Roseitalea TaxID=2639107 RepID=UPI00273D41A7|nr:MULTISPECIES: TrkA family potassium uptake protein [unclassified Roseitalea]